MRKIIFTGILMLFAVETFSAVHTGKLEMSTFLGRQRAQRDGNATFSGGLQLGLEIVEIGIIEFSAETGFGSYPDNKRRVRNFDIALKSVIYNGELFFPYITGGIGLMTYNRTDKTDQADQASVTFAKTTTNFGLGFKLRIKKDFFARADQKYFLFAMNGGLTYRALTSLGILYAF